MNQPLLPEDCILIIFKECLAGNPFMDQLLILASVSSRLRHAIHSARSFIELTLEFKDEPSIYQVCFVVL
jgi:hypothetical protein